MKSRFEKKRRMLKDTIKEKHVKRLLPFKIREINKERQRRSAKQFVNEMVADYYNHIRSKGYKMTV